MRNLDTIVATVGDLRQSHNKGPRNRISIFLPSVKLYFFCQLLCAISQVSKTEEGMK